MELCLSSWCLHRRFLNRDITPVSFPNLARSAFGVSNIEFFEGDYADNFLDPRVDEVHAGLVLEAANAAKISISSFASLVRCDADWQVSQEHAEKCCKHASLLRANSVRVNLGSLGPTSDLVEVSKFLKSMALVAKRYDVVVAVENHPVVLEDTEDVNAFVELFSRLRDDGVSNVELLPDIGAVSVDIWDSAMDKMLPYASQVHLKPQIGEQQGDGIELSQYLAHFAEIAERQNFDGFITYEHPEYREPFEDCYDSILANLSQIASAFAIQLKQPKFPLKRELRRGLVVRDKGIAPPEESIELLLDGCEKKLQSNNSSAFVRFFDFGSNSLYASTTSRHTESIAPGDVKPEDFCHLVDGYPKARSACDEFLGRCVDSVASGTFERISICPFGLLQVAELVKGPNSGRVYGVLIAGPWLEKGTEGMLHESVAALPETSPSLALLQQAGNLAQYSPELIREAQQKLDHLSVVVGELFESRHIKFAAERQLLQLATTFARLSRLEHDIDSRTVFSEELESIRTAFRLDWIKIVGVRQQSGTLRFKDYINVGDVAHETTVASNSMDEVIDLYLNTLSLKSRNGIGHSRSLSQGKFLVWKFRSGEITRDDSNGRLEQLAGEVLLALVRIDANRAQSRERKRLEVFVGRATSALAAPFQMIADAAGYISARASDQPHVGIGSLSEQVADLMKACGETAHTLKRFRFAVMFSGDVPYKAKTFDLEPMLQNAGERHKKQMQAKDLTWEFKSLSTAPAEVTADSDAIQELLDNAMDNAVCFSVPKTTITVISERSEELDGSSWSLKTHGVRVSVSNVAEGLEGEDLQKLFELSTRGSNSAAHEHLGSGLGLFICRQITTAASAHISIRFEDGRFSLVVDLPAEL